MDRNFFIYDLVVNFLFSQCLEEVKTLVTVRAKFHSIQIQLAPRVC